MTPSPRKNLAMKPFAFSSRLRAARRAALFLIACVSWLAVPARAQVNPTVTSCGLPAGGNINVTVTYTLSADCTLTSTLRIANATPGITLTINGAGHTLSGPASGHFISGIATSTLVVNQLTFDGGGIARPLGIQAGTIRLTNVSIKRFRGSALAGVAGGTVQITNTLFENNVSAALLVGDNGSGIRSPANVTMTMNNVVIRNNSRGGAAVTMLTGATLTTSGCLTLSGNLPYDIYGGTWTDNSSGPCSGTIGNGDPAALPPATAAACGFPESGNLDASTTYTLSADCVLSGDLRISEKVHITVRGNGRRLRVPSGFLNIYIAATGSLSINNLSVSGVRIYNYGSFTADRYHVEQLTTSAIYNIGSATINRIIIENLNAPGSSGAIIAWNPYGKGDTTLTDAIIRNNVNRRGALANFNASITLTGCITLENNTPMDFFGTVTDQRSGACDEADIRPRIPPITPTGDILHQRRPLNCFQQLGAIGLICHNQKEGANSAIKVWGITDDSTGYFILEVRRAQLDLIQPPRALVACSADGRVAVRVWADRNVTVAMGPSPEGKTHHVTLAKHLKGEVLGTTDTTDGRPCEPLTSVETEAVTVAPALLAPWVRPQTARADGSLVHVVQPGDTIHSIAVAYGLDPLVIVALNQLDRGGRWIFPGQEILIRAADEE